MFRLPFGIRSKNAPARVKALLPCLVLASFGVSTGAFAQCTRNAQLSWVNPAAYTDGSQIQAGELQQVDLFVDGAVADTITDGSEVATVQVTCGTHDFYATATTVNGSTSLMSNLIVRDYPDNRVPNPPNLLDVVVAVIRACESRRPPADLVLVCNYLASR